MKIQILNYLQILNKDAIPKNNIQWKHKRLQIICNNFIYGIIHKVRKSHEYSFNASCQLLAVLHKNTQTPREYKQKHRVLKYCLTFK